MGPGRISLPSLRHYRESRGLTMTELAKLSDVSQPNISRIERGMNKAFRRTARDLAKALRVSVEDLMQEPQEEDAEEKEGAVLVS
jgi:transcriptional regulator with XRE-family HTH domain